ncbi:MAG: hypothetical protein RSA20_10570, partial [Oscillospiraceae bacterium]
NSEQCSNAIINQYFIENPDNMLGTLQMGNSRFGKPTPVLKNQNVDKLEGLLSDVLSSIKAIEQLPEAGESEAKSEYLSADESVKNYTYTIVDGNIYYRENSVLIPYTSSSINKERVEMLCYIRNDVRAVISSQTADVFSQAAFDEALKNLNFSYDRFYKKFGAISLSVNSNAFAKDSDVHLLCSLEYITVDENTGEKFYSKGDMFFKQTIRPKEKNLIFENPLDALNVAIAERGFVDMEYIQGICTRDKARIMAELDPYIFLKPPSENGIVEENSFLSKEEYLCGNVREKLEQAKVLAKKNSAFNKHIVALKAVQPERLSASDINVRLSSHWVDEKFI